MSSYRVLTVLIFNFSSASLQTGESDEEGGEAYQAKEELVERAFAQTRHLMILLTLLSAVNITREN